MTLKKPSLPLYFFVCSALALAGCNSSSGNDNSADAGNPDDSQQGNGNSDDNSNGGSVDNGGNGDSNDNGSSDGDSRSASVSWIHPLPQGYNLNAVMEHNGKLVAVGDKGTVLLSSDGTQWTIAETESSNLRAIAGNSQVLVAVGTRAFYSEDDGVSWQRATLPLISGGLNAVTWTGNNFIALGGETGAHVSSTDGKTWIKVDEGPSLATSSVASNGARLVAGSRHRIYLSEDGGATWQREDQITQGANSNVADVHFNGTEFSIAGGYNQYGFRRSANGKSWSTIGGDFNYAFFDLGARLNALVYANDYYWFADTKGSIHKRAADEASWERLTTVDAETLNSITHTSKGFYAVGDNGSMVSSATGATWSTGNEATLTASGWMNMAQNDQGRMVAVSSNGRAVYSDNGADWQEVQLVGRPTLTDIAWTGTRFVASGTNTVAHSLDGESWTRVDPRTNTNSNAFFSDVAGRGDVWLAMVGGSLASDLVAICTPSGCSMDEAPNGSRSMVATDDGYLVISFGGQARTSEDGQVWTLRERAINSTGMNFVRLSAIGNTVVAAAPTNSGSLTSYSIDGGNTWNEVAFPEGFQVTASALFNDTERFFLKDASRNRLWVSDNGISWDDYPMRHPLNGVASKEGDIYFLGDSNHILKLSIPDQ